MYPTVPKWPMAMLSSPVIRLVQGCDNAGSDTITTPSRNPPSRITTGVSSPAVANTIVSSVAMNNVWWPVRNT